MNWIYYLLEANLYLTVFYALYYLTLRNETYYQLNRFYLLFTSVLSFFIPLFQLGFLKPAPAYETTAQVITRSVHPILVTLMPPVNQTGRDLTDYLLGAYIFVSCILVIHLVIKIYSLISLSYQNKTIINNTYKLIEIGNGANAFSFFNYLFISSDQPQKQTVINHELIHIQQKHSWDILYLQLLKIVNWFNPVMYLLLHSIKEQHEFIADRETSAREENTSVYASFLLNNVYGIGQSGLTNTFFNKSLLKKRIIMLHQKPSGTLARLKYLAALPLCVGLLCASTLAFSKTYGWIDLVPKRQKSTPIILTPLTKADTAKNTINSVSKVNYKNTSITSKGYKYKETGYLINNKADFRVIITEKNGEEKGYFKNSATPAQIKLLKDKYGYTFPSMDIFTKLPPPPPIPGPPHIGMLKPPGTLKLRKAPLRPKLPPPIVFMADTLAPEKPVRPVPLKELKNDQKSESASQHEEYIISYENNTRTVGHAKEAELILSQKPAEKVHPSIYVNGVKYNFKVNLKSGEHLYITSSDSSVVYSANDINAKRKYGDDAKNGIIELHGKPSFTIK